MPLLDTQEQKDTDDPHGFRVGTNSAIAVDIMIKGGATRSEIAKEIEEACGGKTRNGTAINGTGMMTGIIAILEERGYTVESSWRLVPPQN